jgi:hypothetical protein
VGDAVSAAESAIERRLRLGRALSDLLFDVAVVPVADGLPPSRGFEVLSAEDGRALGLDDDDLAYRHTESGEVWTVEVEVAVTSVPRGES